MKLLQITLFSLLMGIAVVANAQGTIKECEKINAKYWKALDKHQRELQKPDDTGAIHYKSNEWIAEQRDTIKEEYVENGCGTWSNRRPY